MFHQSFYPQSQKRASYHNNHVANHFFVPTRSSLYQCTPRPNRSRQNLNFSRDFEQFTMTPDGFPSMSKGSYPFFDSTQWRQNMSKFQQQYRRTPAFHFQDKSTLYYMSDPIITNDNRITIQLTKVHIGPNGDQQRVFVEQEFSNENEFKKFVKNLKSNFEKTFNNHDENQNTNNNNKKSGVIVIEEPDEEPKIYDQQFYNENIGSTNVKSSFVNREQYHQLPFISSGSTIHSNKRRTNKMKYRRQNGKSPAYSRHYEPPPRFQKGNHFNIPLNQNSPRKSNGYQHQSRSYIPPRFARLKDQQKSQPFSQFRRGQQPRTIAENLIFTNNKQHQIRVDRTKSECRPKISFRYRNIIPQYLDYRQQNFIPFVLPSTPLLFRNNQIQFRLFHFFHPNSNHF